VDAGVAALAGIVYNERRARAQKTPSSLPARAPGYCRPKDFPQHAEKALVAVGRENKHASAKFWKSAWGNERSRVKRVRKVIKDAEKR